MEELARCGTLVGNAAEEKTTGLRKYIYDTVVEREDVDMALVKLLRAMTSCHIRAHR